MVKRELPKHCYRKGRKRYVYFVRGNICERIHSEPGSNAFWAEYNRILNGGVTHTPRRTMQKLIDHYMRSHKWAKKAPNTRKSYERSFRYFEDKIGLVDPASIRRRHVIEMRDALAKTPTTAKHPRLSATRQNICVAISPVGRIADAVKVDHDVTS